ncbi:MAG TPA: DoxX family protein [Acidobacteriaceae bacterium]|nr:DoxX family protein [Acidobacteriaceae bacterium]
MQTANAPSKPARITGYVLSTLATLFMLMDAGMKIVCPPFVVTASAPLGYSSIDTLRVIGIVLLAFTILYIIPRTSIFGAILITAFLGGAAEANVRTGQPLFNLAFPILFAIILWGGLWLRNLRLRALVPLAACADCQFQTNRYNTATLPSA